MHVQIMTWDGPRSTELLQASQRAGRERIQPLVDAAPGMRSGLLGGFRAVGPDGAECVVELARDAAALDALDQAVMATELLPGEDPALLTGPDRVLRCVVTDAFGPVADLLSGAVR